MMTSLLSLSSVLLLALFISPSLGQFERQCTCQEYAPCRQALSNPNSFVQCFDRCQNHVTAQGGSYAYARQCVLNYLPQIQSAAACVENNIGQTCAAQNGYQVPRRYESTTELAAFREVNTMLARSGLQSEAGNIVRVGRGIAGCVGRCIQGSNGDCVRRLGCGLSLPSDNVLVATTKACAIAAGFNTYTVRTICSCLVSAGMTQLNNVCQRIIIQ